MASTLRAAVHGTASQWRRVPTAAASEQLLPLFRGSIQGLPAATREGLERAHLWHAGCPTPLSHLRLLTVSFLGFDRVPHAGRLVVNLDAARPLESVFARLYRLRFPIREMVPTSDAGDDTAAFECRDAVASPCLGTPPTHSWSEHAYGEAVDVNPSGTCVKTAAEGYVAYRHVRNLAGFRSSRPSTRGISEDRDAAMRAEASEVVERIRADERAKVLAEVASAVAAMS